MSACRKIILVIFLALGSLVVPPFLGKSVAARSSEALQANVLPKENDEMRIMELEEYLSELRYYHKGLTGHLSPELMAAVAEFQKDQKSKTEHGHFSEADYKTLRDRYWLVQEPVTLPDPFGFVVGKDNLTALGGWVYKGGTFLGAGHSVVSCSLQQKSCSVVDYLYGRVVPSGSLAWHATIRSQQQDYVIDLIENEKIIAHAMQYDGYSEIRKKWDLGTQAYLRNCDEVYLNIDLKTHEVTRTTVISGKKDGGSCEEQWRHFPDAIRTPNRVQLMDVREGMFHKQCLMHMSAAVAYKKQENKEGGERFAKWFCSRNLEGFLSLEPTVGEQYRLPVLQPKIEE